jgi:hypothetical protein
MERSTLEHVADLVIRRALTEVDYTGADLWEALRAAYPFGDSPEGRVVWVQALLDHPRVLQTLELCNLDHQDVAAYRTSSSCLRMLAQRLSQSN